MDGVENTGVVHTLVIDGWHPSTLNQLMRCHWGKSARMKRADREIVWAEALVQRVAKAEGRRRVDLVIDVEKGQRRPDRDAWWKSTLDALVGAGLLVDDGPRWCVPGSVSYRRTGRRRTAIVLTDLG